MRFVVLAAHPDDETLGAGGLLALLHSLGADVEVLLCTAGEGSHPDSATMTPEQLAAVRIEEFAAAMDVVGTGRAVAFLGLPDGGLAERKPEISARLREAITSACPGTRRQLVIVAPYRADGHADHDAVGAAAAESPSKAGMPCWNIPSGTGSGPRRRTPPGSPGSGFPSALTSRRPRLPPWAPTPARCARCPLWPGTKCCSAKAFWSTFQRAFETFAWTRPGAPRGAAGTGRRVGAPHERGRATDFRCCALGVRGSVGVHHQLVRAPKAQPDARRTAPGTVTSRAWRSGARSER